MAEPGRRRRPAVSCSLCRHHKIRCNREAPCSSCVRYCRGLLCVYDRAPPLRPRPSAGAPSAPSSGRDSLPSNRASMSSAASMIHSQTSPSFPTSSATIPTTASHQEPDAERLRARIKELEEQLSFGGPSGAQSSASPALTTVETTKSGISGEFHIENQGRWDGHSQGRVRSVMHKTRLFGQSNWITGVIAIHEIFELLEPYTRGETKATSGLQRCKQLARAIKAQRAPPWPAVPRSELPPKAVADKLVDCYVRNTESIYRILHIPTFKRDYESLWHSQTAPAPDDDAFLVQLKLVLAIGATTHDNDFSLRASAVQWVYEAQAWFEEPQFKSRLSIQCLQTHILLILAREMAGIGGALVWISAGALLRTAVHMGLHRDPSRLPKRPTFFVAEMRRRLWNTVLELALDTSIESGGPPFISLADFDAEVPGNVDDVDLELGAQQRLPPEEAFTETTVPILLRRTFAHRLAIAKLLNDLGSECTYDEALRLDKEFRAVYQSLSRILQTYRSSGTGRTPTHFQIGVVDLIMKNYLLCLHIPFFSPSVAAAAFAFSRTVVVETALKVWQTACSPASTLLLDGDAPPPDKELERLAALSQTFIRRLGMKTSLLISMDLKGQVQEDNGLGPITLRPDMARVMEEAKAWCLRSILAGETNIKGYILTCLVSTYVDGLRRRLGREELVILMLKAVEEAEDICLPILERMAIEGRDEGALVSLDHMSLNTPFDDWDLVFPAPSSGLGNAESMSWLLDDDANQEFLTL